MVVRPISTATRMMGVAELLNRPRSADRVRKSTP
jgi:hypothetical protein